MAKMLGNIPVLVGQDRARVGQMALEKFKPDIIILDDAFQHIKLRRDINILLLDGRQPLGNRYLLPRGMLREPVSSLRRSDAIIFTHSGAENNVAPDQTRTESMEIINRLKEARPLFKTRHIPYVNMLKPGVNDSPVTISRKPGTKIVEDLKGKRVTCFSGIARNIDFRRTVDGLGCIVSEFFEFPDHHWYTEEDLKRIKVSAASAGTDGSITTEKDYARITHRAAWPTGLAIVGIKISFDDDTEAFGNFINKRLERISIR